MSTWIERKIKGSIAEACARSHFDALGYAIENLGIEYFLSNEAYIRLTSGRGSHISVQLQRLMQRMPDFMMHRQQPDDHAVNDVLLVEAKFRTTLQLSNIARKSCSNCGHSVSMHLYWDEAVACASDKNANCLSCCYSEIINYGDEGKAKRQPGNVLFYVVGRNVTLDGKSLKSHILINLAFSPQWWSPNDKDETYFDKFAKFPIYKGTEPNVDFVSVARDFIEPALVEVLGSG